MSSIFREVFIGNLIYLAGVCVAPVAGPLQKMGKTYSFYFISFPSITIRGYVSGSFCQKKEDKESSPAGNGKMAGCSEAPPLITVNEQTLDLDGNHQQLHSRNEDDITPTVDNSTV